MNGSIQGRSDEIDYWLRKREIRNENGTCPYSELSWSGVQDELGLDDGTVHNLQKCLYYKAKLYPPRDTVSPCRMD